MKCTFLLLAIIVLSFSSCKKDDVTTERKDLVVSRDNVNAILMLGNWYIASSTTTTGSTNTGDYDGYSISFSIDNKAYFTKADNEYLVGWQASSNNSGVKMEFMAVQSLPQELQRLNEIWYVARLTETRMTMQEEGHSEQEITFRRK